VRRYGVSSDKWLWEKMVEKISIHEIVFEREEECFRLNFVAGLETGAGLNEGRGMRKVWP
jgi:hypothetical protein